MTTMAAPRELSLRAPVLVSILLHGFVASAVLLARTPPRAAAPPTYRVSLIAAPPAPAQIGVVRPVPPVAAPPAPVARKTPEPPRVKTPPAAKTAPARATKTATPTVAPPVTAPTTPPPAAGGGTVGGRGADVANVKVEGIDFPYPVYLQNVVRQIALQFKPAARGALQAEVAFMIRRDGSIAALRLTKRSSVYSFDQDALAAVELASRAFGPLPPGFSDDVLPIIFSFDPRLIR